MSRFDPRILNRTSERRRLVAALLEQERGEKPSGPEAIPPAPPAADYPLSYAQQRLWFLDQYAGRNAYYNVPLALHLHGPLDVAALEASLATLAERHAALRTIFPTVGDAPRQVVAPPGPLPFVRHDLRTLAADAQAAAVTEHTEAEFNGPFDLSRGPLWRATLLELGAEDAIFILVLHHIVTDGWSMGVLTRELVESYQAWRGGLAPALAALPIQYTDFAVWQRAWLQGDVLAEQVGYWQRQLAALPPPLELPTDFPRPPALTYRGTTYISLIPPEIGAALNALSRQAGATLFMTLMAAFQVLLARYSGQPDVVVGTPIANRTRPELQGLVGFFVNTLALRTNLGGNPTFREVLGRVRDSALAAFAHQDIPFEQVVDAVGPERDPSRSPLFQTLFTLENVGGGSVDLAGLTVHPVEQAFNVAKFDLSLLMNETPEGLLAAWEYSTDLFAAPTIERIAGHFATLLAGIVANPDARLADLPLLAPAERRQVVTEWNATAVPLPTPAIPELFAAQVAARPDAVAVVAEGAQLTYAELDAQANQLAHYLRAHGVGPEVRVGLYLQRSAVAIVAALAVLKAGGAYVPLDPAAPDERLAFLIADTQPVLILTQRTMRAHLPPDAPVVEVDSDPVPWADMPTTGMASGTTLDHLAYIMYTSGSTGQPKGIGIPQRGIVRLITEPNFATLTADDVFLHLASPAFDAATLEIWGALLHGARLVLAPNSPPSLHELAALIQASGVTTLWLTAGLFHQMAEEYPAVLAAVPQLLAGGDVLSPGHVRRVLDQRGPGRLVNGYGPTENTTFTCCYPLPADAEIGASVPIGRPISNTQVYILDGAGQPVPVGVTGEIYTGGAGLARGYWSRPDLTAERFVPDPFGATPGARLYRTGDLGRWRADGVIEFLGRRDNQVKIRGFRIELGEIEAAIRQHPAVRGSVVIARADARGDKTLLAYFLAPAAEAPDAATLRALLRHQLPDYMVPTHFIRLDAWPLTAIGKLDRRALPAPDLARPTTATGTPPRTPLETDIAAIWTAVLNRPTIGVEDNFFDLGGHSLLATQVVSRLREACQVDVPLRAFFGAPTMAGLAAEVERLRGSAPAQAGPALRPAPPAPDYPLSFAQQRLWFLAQLEPTSTAYNVPAAIRLRGALDEAALGAAIAGLVARHAPLRTTFALVDGAPRQVIAAPAPLDLPVVDLSDVPTDDQEMAIARHVAAAGATVFDLARGPLFQAALLRLAPDDHVLLLNMHHIVVDGWSLGPLFGELMELYNARRTGRATDLPALAVQYHDYAVWQREWLAGAVQEAQLAYWRDQLAGPRPVLQLPTDRPRPAVQTHNGALYRWQLPPALSDAARALSRQENATLFMTLLAATQALLARYSGQDDILGGSPIAGRSRPEIEPLIGCFINTLVFRTNLGGNPTFRALLARVRGVALDAYANQDLPFEKLVEELQPDRDLSHSALFQVMLILQNTPNADLALSGLDARWLSSGEAAAKFDLSFNFDDLPETLHGAITYNTDLFDSPTITRMAGHFETLLAAAVAQPDAPLGTLPLLPVAERAALLTPPAPLRADLGDAGTIPALFARQVARTPDALAVAYEGATLTYAELDARANRLAHYLQTLGVGPDVPVGLHLDRSLDLIVGLLGILKAGGAYLPLDPEAPAERVADLLADAQAPVLVTQETMAPADPSVGVQMVRLDADADLLARYPETDPPPSAGPGHLVYVIYTSGSTGRPKGVAVEHRQLVNYLAGILPVLDLPPGANCASVSTLAADLGNTMVFPALCTGGCLHLIARARVTAPAALAAYFRQAGMDYLKIVPSHLTALLNAGEDGVLPRRALVIGGEAASWELVARVQALAPGCRVINHYGPTETTVGVLTYPATPERRVVGGMVPLGLPLAGSAVYVLDRAGQIAPAGVPGEIGIGGAGVARSYLGRPDLTAERFVPDPLNPLPGARLYRTGDQGRYRPDGTIEFLGRIDLQVKIRGYRVELGEINAVLSRHPGLRESVVQARPDANGAPQLVAYVVAADAQAAPTRAELRGFLAERLPSYMVPGQFVFLPALPLTANGKLDPHALPTPDAARAADTTYQAPRTEVEALLVGIWQKVLNVPTVGIHDDYFALGGDSIRVIQIVHDAQQAGLALNTKDVMQHATVYKLAAHLAASAGDAPTRRPPLELLTLPDDALATLPTDLDVEDLYPAAQMQALLIRETLRDAGRLGVYHVQQRFTLADDDEIAPDALQQAIDLLVAQNPILRTAFAVLPGGEIIQVVRRRLAMPLRVEDIRHLEPAAQAATLAGAMRMDRAQPFAVTNPRAALLRFRLFRTGPRESELLMSIHHAISDGWGNTRFLDTLFSLYETLKAGTSATLPAKPNSYKEFVALEREIVASPEAQAFWRQQLADLPLVPALDGRAGGAPDPADSEGQILETLDATLSNGLAQLARTLRVSLKSVYLSAYLDLISEVAGTDQAAVGVISNGRSERLSDPLEALGLFWNLLPVRGAAAGDPAARIAQVQQQLIAQEPYARYPLGQLLADAGQLALFAATFNFLHFHNAQAGDGAGLQVRGSAAYDKLAFPLNLTVSVDPFTAATDLRLEYDPAQTTRATAATWTAQYVARLEALFAALPAGR